ncbi:GTPase Era [Sediminitomix flava]|uniref:GTPase Era n=1 Tax=Sediminitomix flava TaxID=379075 RepID=A0A316A134_SEDFL|nr:GTPase Era [Sediminitomix flava]PWJ43367.1 GTP-binding protein Era [Sediminitomix flava]
MANHKAGFVSIVGKPNVGKSTLMNQLVGEKLSIITSKAQTTRHRIMGIINDDDYQVVYSDTPGIIQPKYKLHESMMGFVNSSLDDADLVLFVTDIYEKYDEEDVIKKLRSMDVPIVLLINKIDQADQEKVLAKIEEWKDILPVKEIIPISALHKFNTKDLLNTILNYMPEHEPFFPKDELTDKPARFFVSEIVREKIFMTYKKEIPYSTEVIVQSFKEEDDIIRIMVDILVERDSQKGILIGNKGIKLKHVGIDSRKDIEAFFGKKVHITTYVKVDPNWRENARKLREYGYGKE